MTGSPFLTSAPPAADDEPKDAWKLRGACRYEDPEKFFPVERNVDAQQPGKRICRHCPVVVECRVWALTHSEVGIWGGLSEYERRDIQKRMVDDVNSRRR